MSKKKENIIILICSLVIIASIVAFFVIYSNNKIKNSFILNEHLEDTIVTVTFPNDISSKLNISSCNISLKELSYYILVMEAGVNHTASLYNPNNLNSYWNLYISNTFVKSQAKDSTMDVCIRDNIYYYEAFSNNFDLTDDEKSVILDEASYIYSNLTAKQVDATNLTLEDLYNVRYKIGLTTKYINKLMSEDGLTEEELNIDGSYYSSLYENYDIQIDELWSTIELGNITIDR